MICYVGMNDSAGIAGGLNAAHETMAFLCSLVYLMQAGWLADVLSLMCFGVDQFGAWSGSSSSLFSIFSTRD